MSLVGFGVRVWLRRCLIFLIAVAAVALPASAAAEPYASKIVTDGLSATDSAHGAWVEAESRDGARIVFSTSESLAASDTDATFDLYARSGAGAPVHLTDNPSGPDGEHATWFAGASEDAGYVYFETDERLLASDTDVADDLYLRTPSGALVHVSDRPVGADGGYHAEALAVSDDGLRICFYTEESLLGEDGETERDVYELGPGGLRLISEDQLLADDSARVRFEYASPDGARVYFSTEQSLKMSDEDEAEDVYMRGTGPLLFHVSDDSNAVDADRDASFVGESASGERAWFETDESLAATDTDDSMDVYERAPDGTLLNVTDGSPGPDAETSAYVAGWSADGARLFVETAAPLTATDTDAVLDVYRRDPNGSFVHLSDGSSDPDAPYSAYFQGASDAGSTVAFETLAELTASDNDAMYDVYVRTADGVLHHVSDDRAGADDALEADLLAVSSNGSRVLLQTQESLVSGDTDGRRDIYLWSGGELVNLSDNPVGPDAALPVFDAIWPPDLTRVYFYTAERLAAEDGDDAEDSYLAYPAPVGPGGGGGGETGPRAATPPGDATPPRLTGLRVVPRQLARGGAAIRFSLSEPARVRFTVRHGKRVIGGFSRAAVADANRLRFPAGLTRRLSGERFELRAVPRDAAGNRGAPRRAQFAASPSPTASPERNSR